MVVFACPVDPVERPAQLPAAAPLEAPPERDLASRGIRLVPGEAPAPQLVLALHDPTRRAA